MAMVGAIQVGEVKNLEAEKKATKEIASKFFINVNKAFLGEKGRLRYFLSRHTLL